jgi:hypothetical protein
VLLDHREEIAEESALVGSQLPRDRIRAWRPRVADGLADARVAASICRRRGGATLAVDLGGAG